MDILANAGGVSAVHEAFSWHKGLRLEQRRVGGIRIVSVGSGPRGSQLVRAACSAAAVASREDECRQQRAPSLYYSFVCECDRGGLKTGHTTHRRDLFFLIDPLLGHTHAPTNHTVDATQTDKHK